MHWAYKKIEELYPELKRIKRRKAVNTPIVSPAPLYTVGLDGEKEEIPLPTKKDKKLSVKQKILIKKWSKDTTVANLIFHNEY